MIGQRRCGYSLLPIALVLVTGSLLSGCANDNVDDLVSYVAKIRETRKGKVKPLPPLVKEEGFRYQASNLRDPFLSITGLQRMNKHRKNSGVHPDAKRKREPLEAFQLDTLRMVGSLQKAGQLVALVQSPDGAVYQVRKNNHLGHNHGRVTELSRDRIKITEIISDGMGGWMERPAQISLKD